MRNSESLLGRLVLVVCNVAGMMDLVALPLWVAVLIKSHAMEPREAGFIVTCYVLGVFASSVVLAPRFNRMTGAQVAIGGFAVGALAFFALAGVEGFVIIALLHGLAGLGTGCGLSFTHGTIARTASPHQMFAMAGLGVGIFAVLFFATMPTLIAAHGAKGLFYVFGALQATAALAAVLAFPRIRDASAAAIAVPRAGLSSLTTRAFVGVACFAITQSMIFSFVEPLGEARGFSPAQVGVMLLIGGLFNLTAPIMAWILERHVSAFAVSTFALPIHGIIGALATVTSVYVPWAAELVLFVWLILVGHNFMFGLIARLDPTGRTAASTPAMLMIGAAIGPFLGGTLIQAFGFPSLGVAALVFATGGTLCFLSVWRDRDAGASTTTIPTVGANRSFLTNA